MAPNHRARKTVEHLGMQLTGKRQPTCEKAASGCSEVEDVDTRFCFVQPTSQSEFSWRSAMRAVLVSTYRIGPPALRFELAGGLAGRGGCRVMCMDLAVDKLNEETVSAADMVAFYLPMHTATRLATRVIERIRILNPRARIAAYGLYAPMNTDLLHRLGVQDVIGGEFEDELVQLLKPADTNANRYKERVSLPKLHFQVPDRSTLPPLERYAFLTMPGGDRKTVGYTEASRGCKHRCRQLPGGPRLRRSFPCCSAGYRPGGYPAAGPRGRSAYHLWGSGLFQWQPTRHRRC